MLINNEIINIYESILYYRDNIGQTGKLIFIVSRRIDWQNRCSDFIKHYLVDENAGKIIYIGFNVEY